jgi:hypothetical protein
MTSEHCFTKAVYDPSYRYLRKFADSSNGSEKVEKAVWLAEHIGTFPTEVFLSTISKLA